MGIYNILDYGAVSDGGLATETIQKAIDACFLGGGGTVLVPEGNYLTGGLRIRSNVTLHLQKNAVLVGSRNPEDYTTYLADSLEPLTEADINEPVSTSLSDSRSVVPCSRWNNAVIRGIRAKNIAIIGEEGSVIDGRNCFDAIGEENYRGPHGINLWYCENITLKGYTIRDCANWGHAIQNSRNIQAERITVLGGHDGFDVRTCDDVTIRSCQFLTGDDCIAGFDNNNVTVTDCTYSSACSFLRFGGHKRHLRQRFDMVLSSRGIHPEVFMESYNFDAVYRMISSGFGISFLPETTIKHMPDWERLNYLALEDPALVDTLSLAFYKKPLFLADLTGLLQKQYENESLEKVF